MTIVQDKSVTFPDLLPALRTQMSDLRGRLMANQPLAELTWFRVGGPAQLLFMPEDEQDLACFQAHLPAEIPITVIGLGSNLIIRDGGIPGAVGGALRMNGGAYGGETRDALIEARGVDRSGRICVFSNADMHYSYRHCGVASDVIFTEALFRGTPGDGAVIAAEMDKITESREATQPIKSRTGGSTFKNPPGNKAWQLIDAAGCRGLTVGAAQVSELHCNFLINRGGATAAEIETLGETVRTRVHETSGIELEWEIKRIGVAPQ
jgi:UDP-N-acetylmuramate dehydrogenase